VIVTAAPAPADEQYWGAIAYSLLDGASGVSSQQANESDARKAALLDCGNYGGSGCEIGVTVERPKCASLVANESLFSTGVAERPVDAKNSAMADLRYLTSASRASSEHANVRHIYTSPLTCTSLTCTSLTGSYPSGTYPPVNS
jgi:hypothetical protein